jgi:virginiamycin B lyase
VTVFTDPALSSPHLIVSGPDGAVWFYNGPASPGVCPPACGTIAKITTAGVVTNLGAPEAQVDSMTVGPDGALWFTMPFDGCSSCDGAIGRMTTSGSITVFHDTSIPAPTRAPMEITAGPDGALWYTNLDDLDLGQWSIGRITTAGVFTHYPLAAGAQPSAITAGPDGALWYLQNNGIWRVSTAGTITHALNGNFFPLDAAAGTDGSLWFTENTQGGLLHRFTLTGGLTTFKVPFRALALTAGADNAMWFTAAGPHLGRITPGGKVTTFTDPSFTFVNIVTSGSITAGPDGDVWISRFFRTPAILRVTTGRSVTSAPAIGAAGAALALTGHGFTPGETVDVRYQTGPQAPGSRENFPLCSAIAQPDGSFSCIAAVPAGGGAGTRTIKAKGQTSGGKASSLFLRLTS